MPSADPEPGDSTGLEPGGGVPPGETPPDSGSVAGQPVQENGPRSWTPWLWIVGISLPALLIAVFVFADGVLRVL